MSFAPPPRPGPLHPGHGGSPRSAVWGTVFLATSVPHPRVSKGTWRVCCFEHDKIRLRASLCNLAFFHLTCPFWLRVGTVCSDWCCSQLSSAHPDGRCPALGSGGQQYPPSRLCSEQPFTAVNNPLHRLCLVFSVHKCTRAHGKALSDGPGKGGARGGRKGKPGLASQRQLLRKSPL